MSEENKPSDEHEVALRTNEQTRALLLGAIMKGGKAPDDLDSIKVAASLINDSDRQHLTRKKIKVDADNGNKAANAAVLIAQMLNDPNIRGIKPTDNPGDYVPKLPDDLPLPEIVPGELDTNGSMLDYKTFTGK